MVEIDGSVGEGGGQILRTSLTLAMATGQAVKLTNIRAGRAKPGLMRQHLTCIHAAVAISGARAVGAELGSQQLVFEPGHVRAGEYRFDVGSAGSCTLVLQTIWPALMLAERASHVHLTGGTHNPMAPPFHFLQRSYAPLLARLGAPAQLTLKRMGFYPAGGGVIEAVIEPAATLAPVDIVDRGAQVQAYAECFAPALPRAVAHRELEQLKALLGWRYEADQLKVGECRQNEGPGNALLATLAYEQVTEVLTQFGEKGISAERIGRRLSDAVRHYLSHEGALGEHLTDQWALPLALAVWKTGHPARFSCTMLSPHAKTNFALIERWLPVRWTVERRGRGWQAAVAIGPNDRAAQRTVP